MESTAEKGLKKDLNPDPALPLAEKSNLPASIDSRVAKAQKAKQERIARGLSAYRTPYEILADKPNSMRAAINAKCYECQGGDPDCPPDPGWQWAVGNCESYTCPLHSFRRYLKKLGTPGEGVYRDHYGGDTA